MTVLEKAKAKLDAAQRGISYRLPGYDKSDLQWWTAYIEGAEDQKREDADAIEALQAKAPHWVSVEDPPKKEGKYFVAYRRSIVDGYGYDTAYYTKHLEDKQLMIPVPENSEGWFNWSDYNDCDVLVCPDYWLPIEPPQEVLG